MGISADKRYLLNKMNSVAANTQLGTAVNKTKNELIAIYDFAKLGGAVGDISLIDVDGNPAVLPSRAVVTNVIAHVITGVTSGGSATVALKGNSGADLMTATAKASLTAAALVAGVPVGTAASAVIITADRTVKATVAVAALTAGKVAYLIEYHQSI